MSQEHVYPVKPEWEAKALLDAETYKQWYEESIADPNAFWAKHAQRLDWFKPFTKVKNTTFDGDVSIKWFEDGELNVSHNCIDRHLATRGDQVAIIWEGDNPEESRKITYRELHEQVSRLANVLFLEYL